MGKTPLTNVGIAQVLKAYVMLGRLNPLAWISPYLLGILVVFGVRGIGWLVNPIAEGLLLSCILIMIVTNTALIVAGKKVKSVTVVQIAKLFLTLILFFVVSTVLPLLLGYRIRRLFILELLVMIAIYVFISLIIYSIIDNDGENRLSVRVWIGGNALFYAKLSFIYFVLMVLIMLCVIALINSIADIKTRQITSTFIGIYVHALLMPLAFVYVAEKRRAIADYGTVNE